MRNSRRLAMVASAVIATGALIAGSAGGAAAETSSFEATARADALTISVFGTTLTTSAATARLTEDTAKATATETLLQPMSDLMVEQSGPGEKSDAPETCQGSDLTAVP